MNEETRMFPAEAAEKLNIAIVTLRKYSDIYENLIENENHFTRTKTKGRTYSDADIAFFKEVIQLKGVSDTPNKPVESIMKAIIEQKRAIAYNPTYMPNNNDIALQLSLNTALTAIEGQADVVTSLLTIINEQNKQINEQHEMFKKQNKNIEKLVNKLDEITEQEAVPEKKSVFSLFNRKSK